MDRTSLSQCQCGCKTPASWNRLHPVMGPNRKRFFVLDECRADFIQELKACETLHRIVHGTKSMWFWQRWQFVNLLFNAQIVIHKRRIGLEQAVRDARRIASLYLLPQSLCRFVARIWQPAEQ